MIHLIWAQTVDGAIGKDNQIPWEIPEDLRFFRMMTVDQTVVMGRKTWDSLPLKPLPARRNIVLSRTVGSLPGAIVYNDIEQVLEDPDSNEIWVIGGSEIYHEFLPYADRIIITRVYLDCDGDSFAPDLRHDDWDIDLLGDKTRSVSGLEYDVLYCERKN